MLKLLINFTSLKTRSLVWNRIQSIIGRQIGWTKTGYYKRIQLKIPNNVDYGKVKPLTVHPTPKLTFRTKSTLWNLFLQMWSTTRPKSNSHFTVNREFRLFFLASSRRSSSSALVNPRAYFNRWVNTYNFIFNLFFIESSTQLMCNKMFLEETLIFNWQYSNEEYKLFKFLQPFFNFSDLSHGEFVHDVTLQLAKRNLDFLIIADLKTHYKFINYLRRYHFFMIALVPINYSPWDISYAIPSFSDSYLVQYFFLKFIINVQLQARSLRYTQRRNNLTLDY